MNEFVVGLRMALKVGGLVDPDALEMTKTEDGFTVKWVDCGLRDMAMLQNYSGTQVAHCASRAS